MTAAALLGLAIAVYAALCIFFPMARCGRCKGNGRLRQPFGKAWRPCGGCDGRGHRVRLGRRVFGWFIGPYE
jgi:hypothetical protein